jgi:hypothetical protein
MKLPDNVKSFGEICDYVKEVYETKNGDYGDTWYFVQDMLGNDPVETIWTRCLEKVKRVCMLMRRAKDGQGGPLVHDESMMDSMMDIVVYILSAVKHVQGQKQVSPAKLAAQWDTDLLRYLLNNTVLPGEDNPGFPCCDPAPKNPFTSFASGSFHCVPVDQLGELVTLYRDTIKNGDNGC